MKLKKRKKIFIFFKRSFTCFILDVFFKETTKNKKKHLNKKEKKNKEKKY